MADDAAELLAAVEEARRTAPPKFAEAWAEQAFDLMGGLDQYRRSRRGRVGMREQIVYVTEDANARFGMLIVGPGCMPKAYLDHLAVGHAAYRAARTVGDARALPGEWASLAIPVGAGWDYEVQEDDDLPGTEPGDLIDAGDLPDDFPLWEGWAAPILEDQDLPWGNPLPWEIGSPWDYETWMPPSVLAMADRGDLTSPMQNSARWSFESVPLARIVEAFEAEGWEVRVDEDAMARHLIVPW